MKKSVTMIPATINPLTSAPLGETRKRRVAGYARVSTDSEEQQTSYTAQVDYYTKYIQSREEWEFISVYTDEGISATTTAKRDGFNRMINDAVSGKLDLIVTKSVSRFARNTVDSLSTIRKLKEHGVECYFEKENIWTFDGKGELLITIMSSLAQEESRSISENCTWGQRKRMQDGRASVPFSRFLGYERGEDGSFVINEDEAVIVRRIFKMYLEGYAGYAIAKQLTAEGIPTPTGKQNWSQTTIVNILKNVKYKGDALLQKYYTVDFLTKKKRVNTGEVQQYYVENAHPGIVDATVFEMVQQELAKRGKSGSRHSGGSIFSSRIKCGECGAWYGSKTWHSTTKYRRVIYQCNKKFKGKEKCATPHLYEDTIKQHFITAANKLMAGKDEIIANFELIKQALFDTADLEAEQAALQSEMAVITELIKEAVAENAHVALDQMEYNRKHAALVERYKAAKDRSDEVTATASDKKARAIALEAFISALANQGLIEVFDEQLWCSLVDYVTIEGDGKMVFVFKNGVSVQI